mmetsp:Transcript_4968/g.10333  ORF Transcript_4968/g.10333 Transcript_4968/m.10333 type:complete len:243 (-) Transcript_4968:212-940(-)
MRRQPSPLLRMVSSRSQVRRSLPATQKSPASMATMNAAETAKEAVVARTSTATEMALVKEVRETTRTVKEDMMRTMIGTIAGGATTAEAAVEEEVAEAVVEEETAEITVEGPGTTTVGTVTMTAATVTMIAGIATTIVAGMTTTETGAGMTMIAVIDVTMIMTATDATDATGTMIDAIATMIDAIVTMTAAAMTAAMTAATIAAMTAVTIAEIAVKIEMKSPPRTTTQSASRCTFWCVDLSV